MWYDDFDNIPKKIVKKYKISSLKEYNEVVSFSKNYLRCKHQSLYIKLKKKFRYYIEDYFWAVENKPEIIFEWKFEKENKK